MANGLGSLGMLKTIRETVRSCSLVRGISIMLQRSKKLIAELGWFNSVVYLLDRLFCKLGGRARLHNYYIVAQPVPAKALAPRRLGKRIEVHQISTPEELGAAFGRPPEIIKIRLQEGAICLAGLIEDELVGFLWLKLDAYDEDEVRCRFIPQPKGKAAWDFDVYVEPKHRLSLTFVRLWDEANHFLRDHGYEWVMGRIDASALASLASHRRLGTNIVGRAIFLKIARYQVTFANLPPYLHLSTHPEVTPEVRVVAPVQAE